MIFAAIFICVIVCAGFWPLIIESRRKEIDARDRQRSGLLSAALKNGTTSYQWRGPTDGPVVIAIHGLTTPSVVWDAIAQDLAMNGARVLTYDLWARGFSDAPTGHHDAAYFTDQLHELITYLQIEAPVTLLGYSMGAQIAVSFALARPRCVGKLVLVAAAGIETVEGRFDMFCRRVPVLGDWAHAAFAALQLRKTRPMAGLIPSQVVKMQRMQMARRGYLPAILAARRGILTQIQEQQHRALAKLRIPMLAIWARDDQTIPLRCMGRLAQWNRAAHHVEISGAGHRVPYTHGREVSAAISKFLTN